MRVILIDDEPLARSVLADYLAKYPDVEIVDECNDGFEGVKSIGQHQPDLIFLDIQMPKINGFEMLELLDTPPKVIFTTAFDEYAIKAFEAHAIDYLLKPFSADRLDKAMQKVSVQPEEKNNVEQIINDAAARPHQNDRIIVKTGTKITIVPVADVTYLQADDDYVNIHTPAGAFLKNKTMSFFESFLDPSAFVRVHRSYIVRVEEITRLDPYEKETYTAILRNGEKIPVSKTGYAKLKPVLGV